MTKLNNFNRYCISVILFLVIVYLGAKVNFIFKPIVSLITVITIPLMLSVFFYYLLRPLVNQMEIHKINRSLAILLIYAAIAIMFVVFGILVWPPLRAQLTMLVDNAPSLFDTLNEQAKELERNELWSRFIPDDRSPLSAFTQYLNKGYTFVSNYITGMFALFSNIAIIFIIFPIILFYMLKEGDRFGRALVTGFPLRFRKDAAEVVSHIDEALSSFIVGKVIINLSLGVLMYIGFLIIDLPYALLLTVVAVILNFIPFIGSFLSSIPIVIIAFIVSPTTAIWSVFIITAAQQIQDNLIAPYVYGRQLDIHPLTTIILVLIGGDLAGIIGILIIIPVYMIIKIITTKAYQLFFQKKWEEA
ncbi:AI-2E family transporter [Paenibacillus sp. YIM B09110]|uniref:AI-2E family transporter n=1 Tax=Paenibacillus sp. YIM B09110 TaxID=3126102 RepID=UPI00301D82D8